jgi:Tol biopolymer transport system component
LAHVNESIPDIGPYIVDAEIGRGGMGVVYRATDTRLGRSVAIKALPNDLADDAERLARFEREARTLAALNHPNVAGIHGVEEYQGRRYLVLEYVDGETLAERLDRGPLAVDEALEVCAQIARGVEAAHEAGIIHRDLKPGNVKLTPDGRAKVLDFGLAKETVESSSSSVDLTRSPTITAGQSPTAAGVILGTAPYMSPEQARGRPVDRRTDIWSFGVMLYECLTGSSPFVGETVSDSIAAILQADVDFDRLPAAMPRSVRRVLRRCLERDKDRRFRDIGDVGLELVEASEGRDDEPARPDAGNGRSRTSLAWAVAAGALLALVATVTWVVLLQREAPSRLVADIVPQDPEATVSARGGPPAISPDGMRLAVVVERGSEMSLIVRDLSTGNEQTVASGDEIRGPFWSPDARSLAYFDGERMLILAPGAARPEPVPGVTVPSRRLASGSWAPDGTIVYGRLPEGLMRVRPFDGEPELLLDPFPDRSGDRVEFPSFLPDGRRFLFLIFESEGGGTTGVYMGSLDSSEFTLVLPVASNAVYIPSGMLVFSRAGGLQAQRFDIATGRVEGEPIRIASDVRPVSWPPHALFTVSESGRIVYVRGSAADAESEFVWMDRATGDMTPIGVQGSLWNPSLSPDGRFLAFDWTTGETSGDIWIRDLEHGLDTRLTSDPKNESNPVWTPDGRTVVFFRGGDIYRISPDGISEAELLRESTERSYTWAVTPDGRRLLFSTGGEDNAVLLWTLDLETLEAQRWIDRPLTSAPVSMSADGRWVAYTEFVQDRLEVFVRSFPDGETVRRVSIAGGFAPRWSDGGEIFFAAGSSLMASRVRELADGTVEIDRPQQIGLLPPTLPGTRPFDVDPGGTRFLTIRAKHSATGASLRLVEHWGE